MEMEVKRIQKGQKDANKILNFNELEIISVSEEVQNSNIEDVDKVEEHFDTDISSIFLFDEDLRYTKEDLKYNFLVLKWTAWLKLSPFGVDNKNSKNFPKATTSHKSWWGNGISFGWFLFAVLRAFIVILSTVHFGMTENADENLGQMTMMISIMTCACLLMYALSSALFLSAENLAPFSRSIFKYLDADADYELQQKKAQPWKLGLGFGRHTLKELLIILLPFGVYSIAGMIPLLVAFDPSFALVLVSLVQPQISFSFLSLAAVDLMAVLYYITIVHMVFFVFIGMHRIQEEAGLTIKNLKMRSETTTTPTENENSIKIQKALKNIGLLHIWTIFFNRSLSDVVYAGKLVGLTAAISGGFGFIKMMEVENWPYAGIFGLIFLEGNILYNLIFGRAFEISEKVEELKREIRRQSFKVYKEDLLERKYVEKYLRSIPWLGVKDGVYKMERLTCVNFISFVVQETTSLVLAY